MSGNHESKAPQFLSIPRGYCEFLLSRPLHIQRYFLVLFLRLFLYHSTYELYFIQYSLAPSVTSGCPSKFWPSRRCFSHYPWDKVNDLIFLSVTYSSGDGNCGVFYSAGYVRNVTNVRGLSRWIEWMNRTQVSSQTVAML